MSVKNIVYAIPMTTLDSATFIGTYLVLNVGGLPQGCSIIKIVNNSTVDVTVSLDGTTNHDFIPSKSAVVYDFQTNHQVESALSIFPKGQKVYIKGAAGVGLVYLVGWYQPNNS